MNRTEIRQTALQLLAEIAPEADLSAIDPGESLRAQLDLDSMDLLNWVVALHEKLNVEIPESDYPKLATIDGCVDYLDGRLG